MLDGAKDPRSSGGVTGPNAGSRDRSNGVERLVDAVPSTGSTPNNSAEVALRAKLPLPIHRNRIHADSKLSHGFLNWVVSFSP
jgi:hypothetical protein